MFLQKLAYKTQTGEIDIKKFEFLCDIEGLPHKPQRCVAVATEKDKKGNIIKTYISTLKINFGRS
jgi:hypothetical protein